MDALRPLASLASLSALDLVGCPLASGDEAAYRAAVFALLPQLKLLDHRGSDPDAEECVPACMPRHVLRAGVRTSSRACAVPMRRESDDEEDDESEVRPRHAQASPLRRSIACCSRAHNSRGAAGVAGRGGQRRR